MVIQLLDSCESDSYDKAKHGMAHSALNYYGSKFSLIPDVIPGLGYLDFQQAPSVTSSVKKQRLQKQRLQKQRLQRQTIQLHKPVP